MLVRGSNGSYEFIDFRETAPAAAFRDMYEGNINASLYGGLARYRFFLHPWIVNISISFGFYPFSTNKLGLTACRFDFDHLRAHFLILKWRNRPMFVMGQSS